MLLLIRWLIIHLMMILSNHMALEFYQHIGKLFYALTAADNAIREEEFALFNALINDRWILSTGIKTEDTASSILQIKNTFKRLQNLNSNANSCFNECLIYINTNKTLFSPKLKALILNTAQQLASIVANKNKSELIMLAKLELCFKS